MSVVDPARVQGLCEEALRHASHIDRHRFLTTACGDDAGLWNAVWDHLRAHVARESAHTSGTGAAGGTDGERTGDVLGDCHLLQIVGEGPGTTVWMAERYHPATTCHAVKVVNVGANDFLMRHEALRLSLARLEHPCIARAYTSGMTRGGRPFLITDLVSGAPITKFCDEHKLPLSARVRLWVQVCEVMHYAHEKGLAHGSLKPGNILVWWSEEAQPVFTITDFGFAQAMGPAVVTADGHSRTPPPYLAPEQVGTGKADMKGDLLALGTLLFELLTGRLPFILPAPTFHHLEDLRRATRDSGPLRASECLRALPKAQLTAIALARRLDPDRLLGLAEVHFDNLLMRAMQKPPHARPESARAMAEVLRHYQEIAEQEEFHAEGMGSDAGTFMDRSRSMFALGLGIVGVFVVALSIAGFFLWKKMPEQRAAFAVRKAEGDGQGAAFWEKLFARLTPERLKDRDTTLVKEMLEDASSHLEELKGQPATQARMQETIALTYLAMAETTPAQKHLEGALAKRLDALGPEHPDTLRTLREMGSVYHAQGRHAEAAGTLRRTLATQQRVLGPEHPDTFITITVLAAVCEAEEKPLTSEQLYTGLWKLQKKVLGPDHLETLETIGNLAGLLGRQDRHEEAIKLRKEQLELTRSANGPTGPRTITSMNILASAYEAGGQPSEAEKLYVGAMEIMKQALGADDEQTLGQMERVADLHRRQRRPGAALALDQEVLAARLRTLGTTHADTLLSMRHVAQDLDADGKSGAAESMHQDVLEILSNSLGPDHADTLEQTARLAHSYERHGRTAEAVPLHQKVLQARKMVLGASHPKTVAALNQLASTLSRAGRREEAERVQAEAVAAAQAALGKGDPDSLAQMLLLARLQQRHGHAELAEATLNEVLAIQQKALGADHADTQRTLRCLAEVRLAQSRLQEAEKIYQDSLAIERSRKPMDPLLLAECASQLGRLWLDTERAADAVPLLRECLAARPATALPDWRYHSLESLLGHALFTIKQMNEAGPLLHAGYSGLENLQDELPPEARPHLRDSLQRLVLFVEATEGAPAAAPWKAKLAEYDESRPLALR